MCATFCTPLPWLWDILVILSSVTQSLTPVCWCLVMPRKIPSMNCFFLAWVNANNIQCFIPLFWWLLPPVYVFCWDLAQDWDLPAMQALHCAGCPASLQGLQTVILRQTGLCSFSACPECWALPSQQPHSVTLDAVNLDDCLGGMGQFLRMKEVGPEEPSLQPGGHSLKNTLCWVPIT